MSRQGGERPAASVREERPAASVPPMLDIIDFYSFKPPKGAGYKQYDNINICKNYYRCIDICKIILYNV